MGLCMYAWMTEKIHFLEPGQTFQTPVLLHGVRSKVHQVQNLAFSNGQYQMKI